MINFVPYLLFAFWHISFETQLIFFDKDKHVLVFLHAI